MAILSSTIAGEAGLRLLLSPVASNVVLRTACCSVGTVFPIYSTFKSLENKDTKEQERWLMYWAVYGSFSIVEVFSDKLLSWFPCYYHVKLAFLIWLQLPFSCGSEQLYKKYVRPFLLKHQQTFETVVSGTYREVSKMLISHESEIQFLKNAFQVAVAKGYNCMRAMLPPANPSIGSAPRSNLMITGQQEVDSDTE